MSNRLDHANRHNSYTVTLTGEEWAHLLAAAEYTAQRCTPAESPLQHEFIRIHDEAVRQIRLQSEPYMVIANEVTQ